MVAISLVVFVVPLRGCSPSLDFWLMRRYARLDPPGRAGDGDRTSRPTPAIGVLMDLEILWFCSIGVLWSGYFVLEGFDFGVGMLLPFLGRETRRSAARCSQTIGPVWDGNEVWLDRRRRRDVRGVPGLVRDDVLGLLHRAAADAGAPDHARASRSSGASKAERRAGAASGRWTNVDRQLRRRRSSGASRLSNLLYGVPIDSSGEFAGNFWDLFNPYTVFAGLARRPALRCLHGATFLTLRTTGDLRDRAHGIAARLDRRRPRSAPRSCSPGRSSSASTATTRTSSRRHPPRCAIAALAPARSCPCSARGGSGWAFAATAVTIGACGRARSSPSSTPG